MILGIVLASGDSFSNMAKNGQDKLFKDFYLKMFSKSFDKVYVFSYLNEEVDNLPKNVFLISNFLNIHKYFYNILMPFIHYRYFKKVDVIRAYHLFGIIPAVISRLVFGKKFVFNYAYDYFAFAKISRNYIQMIFLTVLMILTGFAAKIFVANKNHLNKFPKSKIAYLPNGVDISFFKLTKKSPSKSKTILSVGRLTKQKNFESLIVAMRGIKAKLIIIGQGELKKKLLLLAKENQVSVEIKGPIPHDQMPRFYNKTKLFVSSSLIEGHPKALLEAMSSSLPIVATNVEGNRELIRNKVNGLLCETSVESIRDSIARLIKDREKAKMLGRQARLTVENEYNLETLLKREVQVLRQLGKNN